MKGAQQQNDVRCRRRDNRAFTIVELLVVVAIVGMLVGLLMPAIQSARESARAAICSNRIRQLSLSVQNYHSGHRRYPANRFRVPQDIGANGRSWSWLARMLPYLEEGTAYQVARIPKSTLGESGVVGQTFPHFICPSDSDVTVRDDAGDFAGHMLAGTNYKAVMGANWGADESQAEEFIGTLWRNVGFNGSYDGQAHGDGVMWRDDAAYRMRAARVRDGLSHTFLVGEDLPRVNAWNSWAYNSHAFGTCAIPLNYNQIFRYRWQDGQSFRSKHPGGANFGMADGSILFVTDEIDQQLYRDYATRESGGNRHEDH